MSSLENSRNSSLSCTTCRQRKIKCDKRSPCSGCRKAEFSCVYPHSRNRMKRESNQALKVRLERLEGLVQSLNKASTRDEKSLPTVSSNSSVRRNNADQGRLVIEGDESRYIENSFWITLSNEVSGIRDLLDVASEDDNDTLRPGSHDWTEEQAYLYSFNSLASSLQTFHPSSDQIMTLWWIFVDQVDPIIRMLHKPSMQTTIMEAQNHLEGMSKPLEALIFSIYFASITSMTQEQCLAELGEGKVALLSRYRFAVQQSLARAGFLSAHSALTLQALVIYLICERNHDDTRLVWTLTAVAIRIAQSLGIHRDGSHLNISSFEAEMRRRIWWQICILDVRTSENHGSDQDIVQQYFDTKLPLNVDDNALIPGAVITPTPQVGITEMSLSLIRYEISGVVCKLRSPPSASVEEQDLDLSTSTIQKIDKITDECRMRLDFHFLRYCNMNIPFHWLIVTVTRMMVAKMWINVHHRFKVGAGNGNLMTQKCRDRLFSTSIEIVESCLLLEREESIRKWKWAFHNFVPWQALAFILSELCVRAQDETVDQAWKTVHSAFDEWADIGQNKRHDLLWVRLRKLFEKAQGMRTSNEVDVSGFCNPDLEANAGIVATRHLTNSTNGVLTDLELPVEENETTWSLNGLSPNLPEIYRTMGQEDCEWPYEDWNLLGHPAGDPFSQLDWAADMGYPQSSSAAEHSNQRSFEQSGSWW